MAQAKKKSPPARAVAPKAKAPAEEWELATEASEAYMRELAEIRIKYRGTIAKARTLRAKLTYAIALIEGRLGAPDVRAGWTRWVDRFALEGRDDSTITREKILATLDTAAYHYESARPIGHWKKSRERVILLTDALGSRLWGDRPFAEEAAEEALTRLSNEDEELANAIRGRDFIVALNSWITRGANVGRRGKTITVDEALAALCKRAGLPTISEVGMRQLRQRWEARRGARKKR